MLDHLKSFSDTIIRLFLAYLIICFVLVSMTGHFKGHRSDQLALKEFKQNYLYFVISKPSKLKDTVKKEWQSLWN